MMMARQIFGLSFVGVAMFLQLMWLPTPNLFFPRYKPDRPFMSLPVADGYRICHGHALAEISWTSKGGWVASDMGLIDVTGLEDFLKKEVERCEVRGFSPLVRIRIPSDAPAKEFLYLVRCMERAGMAGYDIAVARPKDRLF